MQAITKVFSDIVKPYIDSENQTLSTKVTDNINICGAKNLWDNSLALLVAGNRYTAWSGNTYTFRGVTYTVNDDGSVSFSGTASDGDSQFFLPSKVYATNKYVGYLVNGISGGSSSTYFLSIQYSNDGQTWQTEKNLYSADYIIENYNYIRFSIIVKNGVTVSSKIIKLMVRLASDSDGTYVPYAMTNRELTKMMPHRLKSLTSVWSGDTLTFAAPEKINGRWYEFTACVSTGTSYFLKGYIILRTNGNIVINGKQGEYTAAYDQDGHLIITLPESNYWLYDLHEMPIDLYN